jgi:hypothetical protein
MFVASLRTTAAVSLVFVLLATTFLLLGVGEAGATAEPQGAVVVIAEREDDRRATLEQQLLGELLEQERFEPPEEFASKALIRDLSEHEAGGIRRLA